MSFIQRAFQTMHPAAQVVFLACLVLTLMAVAAFAGMLWAAGGDVAAMQSLATSGMDALDRSDVLAMNNLNQLLAFFGASWAFAAMVGRGHLGRFFTGAPSWGMVGLAAALAVGMSPVLDLTYRLNEWALVPGSALHTWAGALEAQAMAMTRSILDLDQGPGLVAVLVSVAVLPALCEEWLFRGTLQPILARGTGNLHVAIWVSAALFSAIHMQFFGFVPRLLLGALFGYLVAYSGSIWPAVVGHFVNNAGVVLVAAWMGPEWLDQGLEPQAWSAWEATDWAQAVGCLVLLAWALRAFVRRGDSSAYTEALASSDA